jgi:hypothetical protein
LNKLKFRELNEYQNLCLILGQVEDECKLTSVDEIAAAVHEMVGRIQEDATSNCMPSVE